MQVQEPGDLDLGKIGEVMELEDDPLLLGKAGDFAMEVSPECQAGRLVGAILDSESGRKLFTGAVGRTGVAPGVVARVCRRAMSRRTCRTLRNIKL